MKMQRHGLSIGIERTDTTIFLTISIIGKLTHQDYETITPLIDAALAEVKDPKVMAYIDASQFEGWELRAAWDDFKLGLKHNNAFDKIALYGKKDWHEWMTKLGSWFMSGEMQFFDSEAKAIAWLTKESTSAG